MSASLPWRSVAGVRRSSASAVLELMQCPFSEVVDELLFTFAHNTFRSPGVVISVSL